MKLGFISILIKNFKLILRSKISLLVFFSPIALASLESLAVLASVIIFYISFGIFLGCIFNKFENGMIISIALAGVFLLLSNKFIVIESLAGPFRQAVLLNPFLFGENLIRSFFINRVSFIFLRPDLVLSLMLSVLLILASAFTFWYTSKQLIN
jgi:ABC-type polysaccharide/polyol phosphate export permease